MVAGSGRDSVILPGTEMTFQLIFTVIFLFLTGNPGLPGEHNDITGQQLSPVKQTGPNFTILQDSVSTVIPFSRAGNLILIQGRADTTQGNFILDTGAPGLVLNRTYFRDYPATPVPEGEQGGLTGGSQNLLRTTVNQFSLGDLGYPRQEAD